MPSVTLLTDFGTRDGYVGAMKGVMASILPGLAIDDISHDIEPGDIAGAARALVRYWDRYPSGTVHVVVVDPGVGTQRRAVAAEVDRRLFVVPDNGVLSRVLDASLDRALVSIENSEFIAPDPSTTFHGRDIFAPAAAYLARGVHLSRLGPRIDDPVRFAEPSPVEEAGGVVGIVVATDRFGNLVTNLPAACVQGGTPDVEIAGRRLRVVGTYDDVPPDSAAALVNSDGRIEVAARRASAAKLLDASIGTLVRVGCSSAAAG